ncbi:MAG: PEP-CTERM sorting domain-containing protein [Burkholderiaceae bacterium]|nr:PEP-CTERM sorting domain-containing protein [Burkholderiaceae bacterium]MDH3461393.1 PEP-CTERM sorting domain-containing protein [Burkholderiaceae bacterium]
MKPVLRSLLPAVLALLGAANLAVADPLGAPGVSVLGAGLHSYKECSTCPDEGSNQSEVAGGNGIANATTTFFDNAAFSWFAAGSLAGDNALPELNAYAQAKVPPLGLGFVSASASALGLQKYHYTGTEDGSYEITFTVDGSLSGDGESVNAGVTAFSSDYDPLLEGAGQNTLLASNSMSIDASLTSGPFAENRSISFNIGAGEDFFVLAFLNANAFWADGLSLPGIADAANTMKASFTAGDVALLLAVPEPTTYAMMLAGLGMVAYASRRARRQRT